MVAMASSEDEPAAFQIGRLVYQAASEHAAENAGAQGLQPRGSGDLSSLRDSTTYEGGIFEEMKSLGSLVGRSRRKGRDTDEVMLFGHDITELHGSGWDAEKYVEKLVLDHLGGKMDENKGSLDLSGGFDADALLGALDGAERTLKALKRLSVTNCNKEMNKLRGFLSAGPKEKISAATVVQKVKEGRTNMKQGILRNDKELRELIDPLNTVLSSKAKLTDARDLIRVLTGGDIPLTRATHVVSSALKHETFMKLPEAARNHLVSVEQELKTLLLRSVEHWAKRPVPQETLRSYFVAAEHLGIESELIRAKVDQLPVFSTPLPLPPTPSSRLEDDVDASAALEPLRTAQWECIDAFKSAPQLAGAIPAKCALFLETLASALLLRRMLPVAKVILQDLEDRMGTDNLETSEELPEGGIPKSSAARRRYLIALAECVHSIQRFCQTLCIKCLTTGSDNKIDSKRSWHSSSTEHMEKLTREVALGLERWTNSFVEIERGWLEEACGECFREVSFVETHGASFVPNYQNSTEAYLRYRVFFFRVMEKIGPMTLKAITCARESLRRCAMVLVPGTLDDRKKGGMDSQTSFDSNKTNHQDGFYKRREVVVGVTSSSSSALRVIVDTLAMRYFAAAETMVQGAAHLVPPQMNFALYQELWSGSSSPLVTYARVLDALTLSSEKIDKFIRTLQVAEVGVFDETTSVIDEVVKVQFTMSERQELREELRNSLRDLAMEAESGISAACAAVGARFKAILSQVKQDGSPERKTLSIDQASYERKDPSPSFVAASLFLDSQIECLISTVRGRNLSHMLEKLALSILQSTLDHWTRSELGSSSDPRTDAEAILRCFASHPRAHSLLSPLTCAAALMCAPANELWDLLVTPEVLKLPGNTVSQLIRKVRGSESQSRVAKAVLALSAETPPGPNGNDADEASLCGYVDE